MNMQRFGIGLTILNLLLLGLLVTQNSSPVVASETPAMLRARGLEIVDAKGRVRASISVVPEATATGTTDTVLLRLITERGRPAIKVSAAEGGSGMSIAGPTGTHQTYLSMGARGTTSTFKLKNEDGTERTLAP
jgi:hypothetical protein